MTPETFVVEEDEGLSYDIPHNKALPFITTSNRNRPRELISSTEDSSEETNGHVSTANNLLYRLYSFLFKRHRYTQLPVDTSDDGAKKGLGTFAGVFVPTWLSISGIILFIRLGYCIGHAGILETLAMFTIGMGIALLTTLSVSAISTNGEVKEGGPYYLISRSLGVEFGGCTGFILCFCGMMGNSMNAFGFLDQLLSDFSVSNGSVGHVLPDGSGFQMLYSSVILLLSALICFKGSDLYTRTSTALFIVICTSVATIIGSFLFQIPFESNKITYTSWSSETFHSNLFSNYTLSYSGNSVESFQSIFGIIYPACSGILAGASMSGDLSKPSHSIPTGTIYAVLTTYITYVVLTFLIGSTMSQTSLKQSFTVLNDFALVPWLVDIGIYSTSIFSIIGGFITSAKIFQAMAKDDILPFLSPFKVSAKYFNEEPILAVILIWIASQLLLFVGDLNAIASVVTMFTLLTYGIINLACFLLKISSAPNFRPTFKYFRWSTALLGFVGCFVCMLVVNPVNASVSTVFFVCLWITIHFVSSPKSWGDIQQALIYHQVRKYLLRLDVRKEHVKYWRPQILLLANLPPASEGLIEFANALKKGSLFVLGYTILGYEISLSNIEEQKRIRLEWLEKIDKLGIKAFFEIIVSENLQTACRSFMMNSGLGAMKPNILLLSWTSRELALEHNTVKIIEEELLLGKSVAIASGFDSISIPPKLNRSWFSNKAANAREKKFIDLYPLYQNAKGESSFTMVLQLGCILSMVPRWSESHTLRIIRLVELDSDLNQETDRVMSLLKNLRINAKVVCVSLETYHQNQSLNRTPTVAPCGNGEFTLYCHDSLESSESVFTPSSGYFSSENLSVFPDTQRTQEPYKTAFERLSTTEQCRLINRIMKLYSHPHHTSVVFSVLPTPSCFRTQEDYIDAIEALTANAGDYGQNGLISGLPPVLLIYGQGVVVTSSL
ncbi:hypothetical protein MP638_001986 [Amoeboaphelidium occidentale]|nr:hypothetical protein MP638_001986 [Amoeboaphelidium occidentale]